MKSDIPSLIAPFIRGGSFSTASYPFLPVCTLLDLRIFSHRAQAASQSKGTEVSFGEPWMAVEKKRPKPLSIPLKVPCVYIYIYLFISIYVSKMVIYCMAKHIQLMVHWWFGARWFGIRIGVPLRIPIPFTTGSQKSKLPTQTNNLPVVDSWIISPGRVKNRKPPRFTCRPWKGTIFEGKIHGTQPSIFRKYVSFQGGIHIYIYMIDAGNTSWYSDTCVYCILYIHTKYLQKWLITFQCLGGATTTPVLSFDVEAQNI